jgi:hypothetical protein
MPPPEPVLSAEDLHAFRKGIEEFNAGLYFECHDTLEDVWNGVRGPARDFFQGLIQVSVAFYHLGGGNLSGAESLFGRALKRLQAYPDRYFGFDVESARGEARAALDWMRSGAPALAGPPPQWRYDAPGGSLGDTAR